MNENQTLTIDGTKIEFIPGETILQAATRAGIYIPRLCYIDGMAPYGGCRLCIVKVVGVPRPIKPSCSTPASPEMNIITLDEELQRMRYDILQLIVSEHPNSCMVCGHKTVCTDNDNQFKEKPEKRVFGCFSCSHKNDCELRKVIEYIGIDELTHEFEYKNYGIENSDPFFERDYNLCILCGKCVRVCGKLRGINAIDFHGRGHDVRISTPLDFLHLETNCQFCGACVDVCPTGVLVPKMSKWTRTRDTFVESICSHCSIGCGLNYFTENGELVETIPNKKSPVNQGQACVFGRFCVAPFNQKSSDRFHTPLLKSDQEQKLTTYSEAFSVCKKLLNKYSPDQIAFLASPDLSNESAFILERFASELVKTSLVATITDNNCMENSNFLNRMPRSFDKIPESDWILLINANPQITHPILLIRIKEAKDHKKKISSLRHLHTTIAPETKWLLDDDLILEEKELINKLDDFQAGAGTILVGPQITSNIQMSIINLWIQNPKINLIPLRTRANLEGVYKIIPKSEDTVMNAIQDQKVKLLVTTERISPAIAKSVEKTILIDIFPSEFSQNADVILPVTTFPESSGTFTNAELKDQTFQSSITPSHDLKPDWQLLCELAQNMGAHGFDYNQVEEISSILPEDPKLNSTDMKPLSSPVQSKTYGKEMMWDDFVFRGEIIANRVDDLKLTNEFRKTNDKNLISQTFESVAQDLNNVVEVVINENGLVNIGTQSFGLDSIITLLAVASISNYRLRFTIDTTIPNLGYINRNKFCMCYNYKDNLNESKVLIEFNPDVCDIYLSGNEIIKAEDGLILIDKKFENMTDEEFKKNVNSNPDEHMMQKRALQRAHQLFKDPEIYYEFDREEADISEKSDTSPKWKFWDILKDSSADIADAVSKPTHRVVQIDQDLCMGCGTCQTICEHEAISYTMKLLNIGIYGEKELRKAEIDQDKCYTCSKCIAHCPVNAITIQEWSEKNT